MMSETHTNNILCHVLERVYNMQIAVCDDEQLFVDSLKDAVYAYSNMYRLEIAVDKFYCGEDLLDSVTDYDIVFLDYKMGGIDGLETAKALRDKNSKCTIIFLTSYPQFVYESFKVAPFRFFKKPLDVQELHEALDDYFTQFGNNYPFIIMVNGEKRCIQTNDVVYLEADNKKCYVNLVNERLHCASTMAQVSKLLPNSIFYKVHRAFIVNFNYIDRYVKEKIYLKNGHYVFSSRMYLSSFRKAFKQFVKGRVA